MRNRWRSIAALGSVVATVACSGSTGGDTAADATLPLAPPRATSPADHTGPASDLAPSQVSASTVPPPATPGPCDVAQLELWTAQVLVAASTADAIIRIRNAGDAWCEPDISASPRLDPEIEPDVWLEPGDWADLVVVGESGCGAPVVVSEVPVDVDGVEVVVGSSVVASCGWALTAFSPNDPAVEPCDELDTAVVDGLVLVRNASFRPCVLGELVATTGAGTDAEPPLDARSRPAIVDLAGGDVVAFGSRGGSDLRCAAVLSFAVAGDVPVDDVRCDAIHELGPGRPWFGERDGPLASFRLGELDPDAALSALDPFGAAA